MHSLTCESIGLPTPTNIENLHDYFEVSEQSCKANRLISTFNTCQRQVFDAVNESLNNTTAPSRFFFIDGPGGSGKTYLYTALISYIRGIGKRVCSFATTGIAADLLQGGRTAHSGFKIPLNATDSSRSKMLMGSFQARRALYRYVFPDPI